MNKTTATRLYLDMDGVVADWVSAAAAIIGHRLEDPQARYSQEDWNKLRSNSRIFRTLAKTAQADQLVKLARRFRSELGYELLFLTAIPHNNDMPWAFTDKVLWAQEHYPDIAVHFGPYSRDKHLHCRTLDILVDDRADNCKSWRLAGGRAIQVDKGCDLTRALIALDQILEIECEARPR
jgi:5'(3')-deoxyribonucleotidase